MELDSLRTLPEADQQVFLLGRIAYETSRVDIGLRFVNGALRGENDIGAYLDAPDRFSDNVKRCVELAKQNPSLSEAGRAAVLNAVAAADAVYRRRNRYIHDFMRDSMLSNGWELARLKRKAGEEQESVAVSFDEMVELIVELVAVTFRLRGCGLYVLNGGWEDMALGTVRGNWDGTATSSR